MPFNAETILKSTDLPEKSRRDVPRAVNRLLGQTFLYQDRESDRDDYYFVHRNRAAFEGLLAATGFALMHDDYHRVFQVVSEYGYCRERYRLDLSLMIVVMRKLYEEQAQQLRLAEDPVVTIGELREEYRTITGKERDLGIMQYEEIMRSLRRLGLVEPVDGRGVDVRDGEARVRLRGSVRMLLPVQTAEDMEAMLRKYRVQDGDDVEEEEVF